ncbi:MAG: hypothetical protein JRJ12_07440 [Deltaproteobacteria bacterium]|nr:hypothetical protein [Deltaproteobacteria bacterium]MBW2071289.1 hypothetical protein [Deltaproteobacteria bacterium]
MFLEEADQQVRLYLLQGYGAYAKRRIPRALDYFHRALEYAGRQRLQQEVALVCRDLAYVYAQEGAGDKALALLDRGLAIQGSGPVVRMGLLANKAGVLVRMGLYKAALELLEEGSRLFRSTYSDSAQAPAAVTVSYEGFVRMARDLRRVVDFLEMGIPAERLQVDIKREEPPWLG